MQVFANPHSVPIKAWVDGVPYDENARKQVENVARLPFIFSHVAVMPDVHWGIGATVGSVIATKGTVIPAAVGVDLGCGLIAQRTTLTALDLPDNLLPLRHAIEASIPHGRTNNGGAGDRGAWGDIPAHVESAYTALHDRLVSLSVRHPKMTAGGRRIHHQLGTLGTGNHFVEICLDEASRVWVMLHSGSRGIGNRIGTYFIELAKEQAAKYFYEAYLPDKDLAYLAEGTPVFDDYLEGVQWAQEFAFLNREVMMGAAIAALEAEIGRTASVDEVAINAHHNYVARENHFGTNVIVTRKGAVRAREGDLGIVPGSMGAKSFIVSGKGIETHSCRVRTGPDASWAGGKPSASSPSMTSRAKRPALSAGKTPA